MDGLSSEPKPPSPSGEGQDAKHPGWGSLKRRRSHIGTTRDPARGVSTTRKACYRGVGCLAWGGERRREMARTMIVVIALALPLLVGCEGFYVAGDAGPHSESFSPSPPPPAHRTPDDTSR